MGMQNGKQCIQKDIESVSSSLGPLWRVRMAFSLMTAWITFQTNYRVVGEMRHHGAYVTSPYYDQALKSRHDLSYFTLVIIQRETMTHCYLLTWKLAEHMHMVDWRTRKGRMINCVKLNICLTEFILDAEREKHLKLVLMEFDEPFSLQS